jgi:glucosamine--fructose-6-phosphate aminotransferase (isomerizing)
VNEETLDFHCPRDAVFEKNLSNIEEVKARKGPVIAISTRATSRSPGLPTKSSYIPKAPITSLPFSQ